MPATSDQLRLEERDIDLVMVTGAGASREFGVNDTKLPLMGDWAEALVQKLWAVPSYLAATGLRRDGLMLGEEFEAQLGKFLRQVEAFSQIRDLLGPSVQFQDLGQALQVLRQEGLLENQWYAPVKSHLDQIVGKIHESLYEQFARDSVAWIKANMAYTELFRALGIGSKEKFVYATTNYDTIAEDAIREFGRLPDWGRPPQDVQGEGGLDVHNLIEGVGRYVPVLHLHGRVGWYRWGGRVFSIDSRQYAPGIGIPIVMLPDPDKVYDKDDIINTLWDQFAEALRRAKRVFVLGHSLNDAYLLQALTLNVDPFDRIAFTVLADETASDRIAESARSVVSTVRENFGVGVDIIPMRFGGGVDGADGISAWMDRLHRGVEGAA